MSTTGAGAKPLKLADVSGGAPPPCFYCSANEYEPFLSGVRDYLQHVPGEWSFVRCRRCGSATLMPHPRLEELSSFYPPVYSFNPELGQQGLAKRFMAWTEYRLFYAPQYKSQVRKILRATAGAPGQRMLDIGCGRGLRLQEFKRHGLDVYGMDLQQAAVDYVNTHLKIPAVCTDVAGLRTKFEPGYFDIVSSFWVMEHVPDARDLLNVCLQLVKPGGWIVCAVPLLDSLQAGYLRTRWVNVAEAPRHLSLPSREGVRKLLGSAGLKDLRIVSDSTVACAGMLGLSLFPGGATSHVYSHSKLRLLLTRALGAGVTLLAVPLCLCENYLLSRPASAIVFAKAPVH